MHPRGPFSLLFLLVVCPLSVASADDERSRSNPLTPETHGAARRILAARAASTPVGNEVEILKAAEALRFDLRRLVRLEEVEGATADWSRLQARRAALLQAREISERRRSTLPAGLTPESRAAPIVSDLVDRVDWILAEADVEERMARARGLLFALERHALERQFRRRDHREPTFVIVDPSRQRSQ